MSVEVLLNHRAQLWAISILFVQILGPRLSSVHLSLGNGGRDGKEGIQPPAGRIFSRPKARGPSLRRNYVGVLRIRSNPHWVGLELGWGWGLQIEDNMKEARKRQSRRDGQKTEQRQVGRWRKQRGRERSPTERDLREAEKGRERGGSA